MHEEQSKYQVWGVKYWNYDELSLAIQNLPTGVQELASLSDISTSTTQSVFCIWFFYTLGWEKKMQGVFLLDLTAHDGKGKTHSACQVWFSWTQVLHTKGTTKQAFVYCVQGKQGVKSAGQSNNTHTHSNTHHTHTEKSRSVKYLNYFTWLLYLSIIWGNLHFSRVQFKQKTCTCP